MIRRRTLIRWRPPPRLTVSEWADEKRFLSPEAAAVPGKWRNARAPHLIAPMDALSPHDPCHQVTLMVSSQTGKTECLLNFIGYVVDMDPGPMLVIQPNVDPMGEAFSKDRVAPMIRDTPSLTEKIATTRQRDRGNTVLHKQFPGGHLTIGGASSPAGLASRPIRYLLGDELDRWETTKEGNALDLARKRTARFHNRKLALTSSPTRAGTGIHAEYAASEQQYELHLRCKHCHRTQRPQLRHLLWEDGNPDSVTYACEHCGGIHDAADEARLKARAEWVCMKNTGWRSKGFWASQLAVLLASWADTVREFLAAKGDASKLQVFTNTALAEVWGDAAEKADGDSLLARREAYSASALPDDILLLTAGVDVQGDRLECEVVGWKASSRDEPPESWGVEYFVLRGDPAQPQVWTDLDLLLLDSWRTESGRQLRISAACVDSGGHHTAQVYAWCRGKRGRKIHAIRGVAGKRPIWPERASKGKSKGIAAAVYGIGVDAAKDATYSRLRITEPGPGYSHWPATDSYGAMYFAGLTCEQVRTRKVRGHEIREWWKPPGARNEPLDCRVYALAALMSLALNWARLASRLPADAVRRHVEIPPPEQPQQQPDPPPQEARPVRASAFWGGRKSFW